jgi:hypothetical protein
MFPVPAFKDILRLHYTQNLDHPKEYKSFTSFWLVPYMHAGVLTVQLYTTQQFMKKGEV